jgi:hypothetical protein
MSFWQLPSSLPKNFFFEQIALRLLFEARSRIGIDRGCGKLRGFIVRDHSRQVPHPERQGKEA